MDSKININLAQAPREPNAELNRALFPVYNALHILQEALQATDITAIGGAASLTTLQAELEAHLASVHLTLADIPEVQQIHYSLLPPDTEAGKDDDIWFTTSAGSPNRVYVKLAGTWRMIGSLAPYTIDLTNTLIWKGAWTVGTAYVKGNVVTSAGAVYMALSNHTASVGNTPPSASWQLIQEAVSAGTSEAVLSSRAPALPGDPPNFVTTSASDLVYARPH